MAWGVGMLGLCLAISCTGERPSGPWPLDPEQPPFNPRTHTVYRAEASIEVDGRLDETSWTAAPWTTDFVNIKGGDAPSPRFRTRAKMLWDDHALYVAARLEEPDVWATLTQRDTTLFRENAFEVFLDPTGTTHNYIELEVNALETGCDLLLPKSYRDGGRTLDAWDMRNLRVGVHVDGTLNEPSDTDEGWTVEIALPWSALEEAAPEDRAPRVGEQWRLNLARVQWPLTVVDDVYQKAVDTSETPVESYSVWSPQGTVNLHRPERWGIIQFANASPGSDSVSATVPPTTYGQWALRRLYYRQRWYKERHGHYASSLAALNANGISLNQRSFEPTLRTTQSMYEITAPGADGATIHIRQDGKTWTTGE